MKLKFKLLGVFLSLFVLLGLNNRVIAGEEITVKQIAKKWKLEKYGYLFYSEDPPEKEKNDYIFLKPDMTFQAISEGEFEKGKWRLDVKQRRIYLSQSNEKEELIFIIDELEEDVLVLLIDAPSDEELEDLKIYYKLVK